ncbi:hypothetical protein L2095_23695 [Bacillus zanthoxyli]|nr:hypothetical protein [Bacillus zanthoxyli]
MADKKFSTDYLLKVSRLIGEIQHLSTVVHLATEMEAEIKYSSHVNMIEFIFAPTQKIFEERFEISKPEELIIEILWLNHTSENEVTKKLLNIKRLLKQALINKGIDYGKLDYTIETVEYKRYIV